MSRLRVPALVALASTLALTAPAAADAAKGKPAKTQYYVSLGDSYATGYQATGVRQGSNTDQGFANQLVPIARSRGHRLKLVNFGCAGATTTSILQTPGCASGARAVGGPAYRRPQAEAAIDFIRRHRKRVGLITVSIGGNDVTACARAADPVPCVAGAVQGIETRVAELARRLRRAAGPKVPIVGITYPDVILGEWVTGNDSLARLSVVAFQQFINPTLEKAYAAGKGAFVDVTAATGAYGSLDETTNLEPYGTIPVPVARVCELTYYCEFQDIHARTPGYGLIADLIAQKLPRRR
ncbi:MAG: hypothetical protein IRZ32_00670 [Solirubrobacteraceae bacterium]|nr:hypothetical protein [Solirubrobacteraceae bacterium]